MSLSASFRVLAEAAENAGKAMDELAAAVDREAEVDYEVTKPKRKRRRAHKGFTNNRRTRQIRGRGRR